MSSALDDVDTTDAARARADRIRAGIRTYVRTLADISDAYAARDWETLGYPDWAAYVEAEFGEDRLRLSPDERQRAVEALRGAAAMSQRAIAVVLGVDQATVSRDLRELAAAGDADASPAAVRGLDGKEYAAARPAAEVVDPLGVCGRCGGSVPREELDEPDAAGRCADCRRQPPETWVTTMQPTVALLPGDFIEVWLGDAGDLPGWDRILKIAVSYKGRKSTGYVWTEGHEEPWEWDGRLEHRARRAPGRTAASGGVTACAGCHQQVPVAITYADKCPACLNGVDNGRKLHENLAALAPDLVPGPEQTLPAARVRVGDLVWVGPSGWEQVYAHQIDPEPDEPGAWQARARTRVPGGPSQSWQWTWDEPQQVRRPVPGEEPTVDAPPAQLGRRAEVDADLDGPVDEDDEEPAPGAVVKPAPPRPVLTGEEIGRLRTALGHARANGWTRTDRHQWEAPFTNPSPHFAEITRLQIAIEPGGLVLTYCTDGYQKWDDYLTPVDAGQALDVLCALRLLPAELSALYRAGP